MTERPVRLLMEASIMVSVLSPSCKSTRMLLTFLSSLVFNAMSRLVSEISPSATAEKSTISAKANADSLFFIS